MRKLFQDHTQAVVVFGVLIALKLAVLLALGPIHTPDSAGYAMLADHLLSDRTWLTYEHLDWDTSLANPEPVTVFRIIGYPLLLALMKTISAVHWDWLIVIAQMALSLVATGYVYRLAHRITASRWAALFAAFAQGAGQALLLDQCILTDSLNASLLLIMLSHVSIAVLDDRRPSWGEALLLGGLVVVAFFIREAGNYLQVLYWPLIAYWGWRTLDGKLRTAALVVVFALPMVVGVEAYKSWNQLRTGERFVTVGGSVAMYFPAVYLEQRGISIFADDPLLGDMGPLPDLPGPVAIVRRSVQAHLIYQHGFDVLQMAQYGTALFYRNWREHPVDMAKLTLSHVSEKQALLSFNPIATIDRAVLWGSGQSAFPKKSQLWNNVINDYRIDQALMVVGRKIERLVSLLISVAFILGVPVLLIRAFRKSRFDLKSHPPEVVLMTLFWLIYAGYTLIYAMISLELRYLMPVAPLTMIAGVTVLSALARRYLPQKLLAGA